ncbi:MAG: hypothetical protein AAF432_12265 [Planctomycetota bacterium]
MLTRKRRSQIGSLMTFLAPVLGLKMVAVVIGGPQLSHGAAESTLEPPVIGPPPPATVITNDLQSAIDRIVGLDVATLDGSPMLKNAPRDDTVEVTIEDVVEDADIEIALQAVMGNAKTGMALISGRPYRVGENIAKSSWRVDAIDHVARSIVIVNGDTGERRTLSVKTSR